MLAFLSTDTAFHVLDQWFLNWGRPPPMEGVKGSQGGREYMAATYCWKAGQWQIIVDLLFVFDLEVNWGRNNNDERKGGATEKVREPLR